MSIIKRENKQITFVLISLFFSSFIKFKAYGILYVISALVISLFRT